jgi:hypothetical protein
LWFCNKNLMENLSISIPFKMKSNARK